MTLRSTLSLLGIVFLSAFIFIIGALAYFEQQLPQVEALKTVKMQEPLRIYTQDKLLIAEFGEMKRMPVPLEEIPKPLIDALIATEDQRYFEHPGVDLFGLFRASVELALTGKKSQGGSTITMQVARNFFLTREKTFNRKIREILLSLKISRELDKDKVLELYLNQVYLGNRAYGVASAAQIYYGKRLDQLTLGEMATLAGLPKAPSYLNPIANPKAAKERREHVLERMLERHYISKKQFNEASAEPIESAYHGAAARVYAPYVAEKVRDQLLNQYGEEIYTSGMKVYTTLDSRLQEAANAAVRRAVQDYDHRHGYRGASAHWDNLLLTRSATLQKQLRKIATVPGLSAVVITDLHEQSAEALTESGTTITIPWSGLSSAQLQLPSGRLGPKLSRADQVLKVGDVVLVKKSREGSWQLSQIPLVQAALVSMNPQNGAVLALVGGYNFEQSNFNRVYQALRQPGSSFKPLLYAAALDKNMTLATIINDEPFTAKASINDVWEPQNDDHQFLGPIPLRTALMRSRNLASIRVLQSIGIPYALTYLKRFGINNVTLPHNLTLALGSGDIYPIQMALAFSVFANGGYKIDDYLIDHIEDVDGQILYQAKPLQACEACITAQQDATEPKIENAAPRVISPQIAYLTTSALQSVIQNGTGRAATALGRSDIAGKTGTTNDEYDAWFNGFNSDIETVAWMGFDNPASLREYGSQSALPLWIDFMQVALQDKPLHTMPRPPGLVSVKINPETGELAKPGDRNAAFETFIAGTEPGGTGRRVPSTIKKDNTESAPTIVKVPETDNSVYGAIY